MTTPALSPRCYGMAPPRPSALSHFVATPFANGVHVRRMILGMRRSPRSLRRHTWKKRLKFPNMYVSIVGARGAERSVAGAEETVRRSACRPRSMCEDADECTHGRVDTELWRVRLGKR